MDSRNRIGIYLIFLAIIFHDAIATCIYRDKSDESVIKKIESKTFEWYDANGKHTYFFGICIKPESKCKVNEENVGMIQCDNDGKGVPIGRFNATDITVTPNWILLEYHEGEIYDTHCGGEKRRATIVITCPKVRGQKPKFQFMEEETTLDNCKYVFGLEIDDVCLEEPPTTVTAAVPSSVPPLETSSPGIVLLVIFICAVGLYLCVGIAYKRICLGARNCAMIPNNVFWQRFGILIADGSDYLFRCRSCGDEGSGGYLSANSSNMQYPPAALVLAHDSNLPPEGAEAAGGQPHLQHRTSFSDDDLERDDILLPI